MISQKAIDLSTLPDYDISAHAPLWWGQALMACIETTMFAILIAMYFYIRLSVDMWPPPGVQLPHIAWPTLALIPLAASCFGSWWASKASKRDDRGGMVLGLGLNLAFAAAFLVLRVIEWRSFNFRWDTDIHGSLVWTIMGLHTFDVIADLVFTAVLLVVIAAGRYGVKERLGVHVDSVVWYVLAAVWIPLYAVVYWAPRYVGAP